MRKCRRNSHHHSSDIDQRFRDEENSVARSKELQEGWVDLIDPKKSGRAKSGIPLLKKLLSLIFKTYENNRYVPTRDSRVFQTESH